MLVKCLKSTLISVLLPIGFAARVEAEAIGPAPALGSHSGSNKVCIVSPFDATVPNGPHARLLKPLNPAQRVHGDPRNASISDPRRFRLQRHALPPNACRAS